MHLIRRDYRIATALLSLFGTTTTALLLVFGQAAADQTQVNRMIKPALKITEVQSHTGTLLTVVQAARMMSTVTTSRPLDAQTDSSARHEKVDAASKQKRLERYLAYHRAINGTPVAGDIRYATAATIAHQTDSSGADVSEPQVGKATVAKAEPVTRKSVIEITDTML